DKKEVSDDEQMTQVNVLMALADDELTVRNNHAHNGEWTGIIVRKEASPSFEVMPLTYQDHSPRERPGSSTMKYTKPETQEFLSKSVLGPVTVCDTEPVTSSVPTKFKNNDQESKIDELTKLVQMLMDEKINFTQKIQEYKPVNPQYESSKILYCMKCKLEDHETTNHNMYVASMKRSENYKARPYQYDSPSKQILKAKAKPYPPCTHSKFQRPSEGVLVESSQSSESSISVSCTTCGSNVHSSTDHNDFKPFKRGKKIQATKARDPTERDTSGSPFGTWTVDSQGV
nr:hypothetical protein [Tanacetum cinerariifolium]